MKIHCLPCCPISFLHHSLMSFANQLHPHKRLLSFPPTPPLPSSPGQSIFLSLKEKNQQKTTKPSLQSTRKTLWKIGQTQTAVNYSCLLELCRSILYNMIVYVHATMKYFPHLRFKMIRFSSEGVPTCLKVGRGAIIFFMQLLDVVKQWAGTEMKSN